LSSAAGSSIPTQPTLPSATEPSTTNE
jgi:hypothetical protein